jgi:hypothetical protein
MKITQIISDGTPGNLRVITEDGTLLGGVQAITWTMKGKDPVPKIYLELAAINILVNIKGELIEQHRPINKTQILGEEE